MRHLSGDFSQATLNPKPISLTSCRRPFADKTANSLLNDSMAKQVNSLTNQLRLQGHKSFRHADLSNLTSICQRRHRPSAHTLPFQIHHSRCSPTSPCPHTPRTCLSLECAECGTLHSDPSLRVLPALRGKPDSPASRHATRRPPPSSALSPIVHEA